MIVANAPPTAWGGVHRPDRNIKPKVKAPVMPWAAACKGAMATRTKPSEKMTAIERMIDMMKRGMFTSSAAWKITSPPKIIIRTVAKAKMRFMIN